MGTSSWLGPKAPASYIREVTAVGIEWFRDLSIAILGFVTTGCTHLCCNTSLPSVSYDKVYNVAGKGESSYLKPFTSH